MVSYVFYHNSKGIYQFYITLKPKINVKKKNKYF